MEDETKKADSQAKFEVYEDAQLLWRWRMVAKNGRIMADSAEGYDTESNARRAVKRAKEIMVEAEVIETDE